MTVRQTAPTHSPDESVHAEPHANVNVTRIGVPPARELFVWLLLGIAIAGDVFNWYYSHDAKTQAWLAEDSCEKLQAGPVADLRAEAKINEALINAYGLRKEVKR